jgi:5-methylcytosine-specific restriction endonuclease McrA
MATYQEQLRDPRWQRKRLEIFKASNFKCEDADCGDDTRELNVHHSAYLKGVPVWDHPDELLHCLCRECHQERQSVEESLKIEMMKRLRKVPIERLKKVFFNVLDEALKEAEL